MYRLNYRLASFLLAFILTIGPADATASSDSCDAANLREELETRKATDQAARQALMKDRESKSLNLTAFKIDRENQVWFLPILRQCGWPETDAVGESAAQAAWLIAQHSDMDPSFQVMAAEKMKKAVMAGQAKGVLLALLVDRNRRMQNQPQVYGMQYNIVNHERIVFLPVHEPETLDARRKEIGLEPFASYVNETVRQKHMPAEWPNGVLYKPADCCSNR